MVAKTFRVGNLLTLICRRRRTGKRNNNECSRMNDMMAINIVN